MIELEFEEDSILGPPREELIRETEDWFEAKFPEDYLEYIRKYNGGHPLKNEFEFEGEKYIIRAMCNMMEEPELNSDPYDRGKFEILVIEAWLFEALYYEGRGGNYGPDIVPIAELAWQRGFVCLDYKDDPEKSKPYISLLDHHKSEFEHPCTRKIADTFSEFLEMLY